jgi:hypothetical protein
MVIGVPPMESGRADVTAGRFRGVAGRYSVRAGGLCIAGGRSRVAAERFVDVDGRLQMVAGRSGVAVGNPVVEATVDDLVWQLE